MREKNFSDKFTFQDEERHKIKNKSFIYTQDFLININYVRLNNVVIKCKNSNLTL